MSPSSQTPRLLLPTTQRLCCCLFLSLLVASTFAQDVDTTTTTTTATTGGIAPLQLAPPWVGWTVTDDNVMGGVSSGAVEEQPASEDDDALLLSFSGTVSFDRNGGFSSASSHGGGSYRVVQLLNNAMGGVTAPTPLDLSRFGEGGGVRVTFRGDDALAAGEQGAPRAVNLNVYETRSRMNFGGFSPSSTSSSFVVYPSSEQQTWFLPFSTFMGSTFTSPDEDRGLPLASLSTKLGMQVSFQEGLFSVALENIEAATNAACAPPSWATEKGPALARTVAAAGSVAAAHLAAAKSVLDKSNYGSGALYPNAGRALLEAGAGLVLFGDTAASKLLADALKEADAEEKTNDTPGVRVDAAIETLETALEGVVRLAAGGGDGVGQKKVASKRDLAEAAKLLFCNY